MKKTEMITTITRECWKQWAHLESLKWEIVSGLENGRYTYAEANKIVEGNQEFKSALDIWFGMSELADKIGVDWLNLGYNTNDIETIDAREDYTQLSIKIWRWCKA